MSILHVNQIAGAMHRLFDGLVDTSDALGSENEKVFLSRALAGFALVQLSGTTPKEAAAAITDGQNDNGIDAAYFEPVSKTMFVVQSKWHADGNGSVDRADVLKFTKGFDDLANQSFERFNDKLRNNETALTEAFFDDQARYVMVIIHTGVHDLAPEPRADLDDCLARFNDTADDDAEELLEAKVLKQSDIHNFIATGVQGRPINLDVALFQWGEAKDPYAVYGQVAAADVAKWWKAHYPQLVAQNLRHFLGSDTEVNSGLQTTLLQEPQRFWHYNNGITAICKDVRPKGLGGKAKEAGLFTCEHVRIVNGAQTAGSIAAACDKNPAAIDSAKVQIRFIAVGEETPSALGDAITKATNTQNRVNRQDFVALDPLQQKLRTELMIDGLNYNFKSGVGGSRDPKTFDLEEATVALACASSDLSHSTLAKREIGKLWEDPSRAPYKALFNPSISSQKLWRMVEIMRHIDRTLAHHRSIASKRGKSLSVHGNRFVAYLVFRRLPVELTDPGLALPSDTREQILRFVSEAIEGLRRKIDEIFPQSYPATLFKNQRKLSVIAKAIAAEAPS